MNRDIRFRQINLWNTSNRPALSSAGSRIRRRESLAGIPPCSLNGLWELVAPKDTAVEISGQLFDGPFLS